MPCAPEFSYLESASADAGDLRTDPELPATAPGALPSLASRHEGFFVAQEPVVQQQNPAQTSQKPSASRRE